MSAKSIDKMTIDELREYARVLEKRLAQYEKPDYVYFLHDAAAGVIKVGHSQAVEQRLKVLSRQTGRDLILLGVMPGNKYLKRRVQQQFKHLLTGDAEWYTAADELMDYIEANTMQLPKKKD